MWLFLCCLGSSQEIHAIEEGIRVNFNQEMKAEVPQEENSRIGIGLLPSIRDVSMCCIGTSSIAGGVWQKKTEYNR